MLENDFVSTLNTLVRQTRVTHHYYVENYRLLLITEGSGG